MFVNAFLMQINTNYNPFKYYYTVLFKNYFILKLINLILLAKWMRLRIEATCKYASLLSP